MRRHELSDDEWNLIEGLFPQRANGTRGRPPRPPRQVLNAILWTLRTGAPWRDLPERYGPWQSIYHRFNSWRKDGTFDRVVEALQIRLDREGKIDWDLWCIDGSAVRASRAAAGAGKKGDRTSPQTTLLAARAVDSAVNCTWLRTAEAFP